MASSLERMPLDILVDIAFLCASSSPFLPPTAVLHLSLTSRTLWTMLSRQTCPQLYARIYRAKFDIAAPARRRISAFFTTTCLADELVERFRVLRRIHHREVTPTVENDLWKVYMMMLEDDGMNERQLIAAGILPYVSELIASGGTSKIPGFTDVAYSLVVWISWLTVSRDFLLREQADVREQILRLLRPFALGSLTDPLQSFISDSPGQDVDHFSRKLTLACPNPTFPAILLTFAREDAIAIQIPRHLPPTRELTDTQPHNGPTMGDFRLYERHSRLKVRSALPSAAFIDQTHPKPSHRSTKYDHDFFRLLLHPLDSSCKVFRKAVYTPGSISGLWEGSLLVATSSYLSEGRRLMPPPHLPNFVCRRPLQCHLREHYCFTPNVPFDVNGRCDDPCAVSWLPTGNTVYQVVENTDGLEFNHVKSSRKIQYQTFHSDVLGKSGRDPRQALDVLISGETDPTHGQAWGAFNFIGRVRLSDGMITLKREPKNAGDANLGTWVFEGYLLGGQFVGRWRPSAALHQGGIGGIFSLGKIDLDAR
ncbi:hypothetical protein JAAARDRAFT_208208 [Jaapia argillacea MUCL 33604]|uniref:F-box domain-containing protein n=1 Tax=Jaapia argillacea MUCL 33604 TaxID=933084 RepID=A0A067PQ63_9AGAM|nr:hypothetical protein JAAARDRAFT_208208 [Jaapia argillacea MUCL 33604]